MSCFVAGTFAKVPVMGNKIRLTDNWEFLRQDVGNIWELVRPIKKGQPEEQPIWTKVTLPHCFNAEDAVDPDLNYYQGPGWYKTRLKLDNPYPDGRMVLEFEGAGQKTDVYVYMTKVGSHVGGYDSWNVDITDAVRAFLASKDAERFGGEIPLSIRCDNTRDAEMIPSDLSDFNLYGGIYRYLNLVYLPEVSVASLRIEPALDAKLKKGKLKVSGTFYNPADVREALVEVTVKNAKGEVVSTRTLDKITPLGDLDMLDIQIDKPQLWDVDHPVLYTCEVTVTANGQKMTASERFGFRSFEFIDKGPFMLNGKRLLLRGTHRHEDHAGVAAAMTEEQMIQEMKMMKEMGVNFIRLGHYQQSEIILNLCDELGILVWEENHARGIEEPEMRHPLFETQAENVIREMIMNHYNHPSIYIWGILNECASETEFGRSCYQKQFALIRQLDATRPCTFASCKFFQDICFDLPDVISCNIYPRWYVDKPVQQYLAEVCDWIKEDGKGKDKPFIVSEIGAGALYGCHNSYHGKWTEEYQAEALAEQLTACLESSECMGVYIWQFCDVRVSSEWFAGRPREMNNKGIVDEYRRPKLAYEKVKEIFQKY